MPNRVTLCDTIILEPVLTEAKGEQACCLEGVFQRADAKNQNGRIYPRKLWEKVLDPKGPWAKKVNERAMIGHLEHPADGRTDIRKASHVVTGLSLQGDGTITGRAELLDTPDGKIAQECARKRVRLGISSRGSGTVGPDGVVEDYDLETFDIVYNPSTIGGFATMSESVEGKENRAMTLNEFQLIEASARQLTEQRIAGMPLYQLTDMSSRLLEASAKLSEAATSNPALSEAARPLLSKLAERREEVETARSLQAGSAQPDSTERAVTEDNLEEKLEEHRSLLREARDTIVESEKKLTAAYALIEEFTERLANADDGEKIKEAAQQVVSALLEQEEEVSVQEAIEACCESSEVIKTNRTLLEGCKTADEVLTRAEQLNKLAGKRTLTEEEQRTLPVNRNITEAEVTEGGTTTVTESVDTSKMSRSARLAQLIR